MRWLRLGVVLLAISVGFQSLCSGAKPAPNLVRNPGFESVRDGVIEIWRTQDYWAGTLESVSDRSEVRGGRRSGKLTTSFSRNMHWGRIMHGVLLQPTPWVPHRFSIWAKGRGELKLGCILYTRKVADKPNYSYLWQDPVVELGGEWQEVVFPLTITDPEVTRIALVVELHGEGSEVWLDDAAFVEAREPGFELVVEPLHAMVPPGQPVQFHISVLKDGGPAGNGNVRIMRIVPEGTPTSDEIALTVSGAATYTFQAGAEAEDEPVKLLFAHPTSGCAKTVFVDVIDTATFAAFEAAAKKTSFENLPVHILVIGDSLTDFHRGANYVDKIGFWLRRVHGPRVTVKNVGVGGDFITRVWGRLTGKPRTHRMEMYEDLLEPMPTHILIFLGHNDTKVTSTSDYTKQCVEPDAFDEQYRLTVEKLKDETGAKIIIMSSISPVYEITKATAEKRAAEGRAHNLFGRPDELERYNVIARKIADDLGCEYLDAYEPTRTHPDKPSLFMADGVHVNHRGNRFLALEILKHFGSD